LAGISTSIEGRLRVHRVVGEVSPTEVAEQIRDNQARRSDAELPALWDLSSASLTDWDLENVLSLASRLRGAFSAPVVAALVVANPEMYGSARVALAMLQSRAPIEGHVFCSEASARAWLRVREHRSTRRASPPPVPRTAGE
jgi:hypothetical protein